MRRPGAISMSGSSATTWPMPSVTRRTSRRRPSPNARTHSDCQVQARNGERSREAPCRASQAEAPTASRLSWISIFTGSQFRCASGVCGFGGAGAPVPLAVRGLALGHGLVHRGLEVLAQVVAKLLSHLLHQAGDAGGIVLVEITERGGIGERLEPGVLALDCHET